MAGDYILPSEKNLSDPCSKLVLKLLDCDPRMRGTSQYIVNQVASLANHCTNESLKKFGPSQVVPLWNQATGSDDNHEALNTNWRKRLFEAASVGRVENVRPAKIQWYDRFQPCYQISEKLYYLVDGV